MGGLASAQVALAAGPILQVTADGTSSVRPSWSPDGTHIAFQTSQDNTYKVFVMAADGSDRRMISQGTVDDRHPAWSPDGKQLAVDSGTELKREVAIIDLTTGARKQVTSMDEFVSFPSWSPDGTRLSFYAYQKGTLDIFTVNTDGTKLVKMTQTLASENKSQCTFACHAATWSPDGSRLAYADGDQMRVFTMRSDDGTDQVKVSHDDPTGRSHFPLYLSDGRLAYVTEHINPGQSWTDIWAITPGSTQAPAALLQDVQVQGPFEFSPDGQRLLFSSPRNGNFDIYVATLDTSGREALKKLSSDTDLSPALAAAGHPAGLASSAPTGASGSSAASSSSSGASQPGAPAAASQPVAAAAPNAGPGGTGILPSGISPYILALGGLALIWIIVEGVMIARRRSRRRGIGSNGQ
ncbi:MAG TPA: LpqB family beta-propeller domain-containing protein [Chloroflexota bacterium]|nr:LpqB family beta-propeller domain-containing protein [Chloroflexota bacterium]